MNIFNEHDIKQGNVVLQAAFLLALFPLLYLVNLKFVICLKSKAKQNNQLIFISPMLFCISYKFMACFSKHNFNVFRFP